MRLIVGLGNPGSQYEATRHNVGFVALDRLARRWAPGATARSRFHGVTVEARIPQLAPAGSAQSSHDESDDRVMLLKPTTYMNRSGAAVAEAVQFFKLLPARDVLVIVDDTALGCGSIRLRPGGSAGGHNGLADVELKLGTDQYARLRIGVDAAGTMPRKDYVLGRFRPDQQPLIEHALDQATDAAACWAEHGIETAMNRFNRTEPT